MEKKGVRMSGPYTPQISARSVPNFRAVGMLSSLTAAGASKPHMLRSTCLQPIVSSKPKLRLPRSFRNWTKSSSAATTSLSWERQPQHQQGALPRRQLGTIGSRSVVTPTEGSSASSSWNGRVPTFTQCWAIAWASRNATKSLVTQVLSHQKTGKPATKPTRHGLAPTFPCSPKSAGIHRVSWTKLVHGPRVLPLFGHAWLLVMGCRVEMLASRWRNSFLRKASMSMQWKEGQHHGHQCRGLAESACKMG